MRDGPNASWDPRRGILLPVVLLLILGIGVASVSVGVLVSTQQLVGRSELRYLENRVRAQTALAGSPTGSDLDGFARIQIDLPGSFSLIEVAPEEGGPSYFSLDWVLNPDSIAAGLPGALASVGLGPDRGVQVLDGCASALARPLVTVAPLDDGPGTPSISAPRLGILGVPELLELADVELPELAILPAGEPVAVRRANPGTVIQGGRGSGVLISAGDLTLLGSTDLVGLLVVQGNLTLMDSARIEGVVLAGGWVQISGGAGIFGCPVLAREALALPSLARAHSLPEGWFLGRY